MIGQNHRHTVVQKRIYGGWQSWEAYNGEYYSQSSHYKEVWRPIVGERLFLEWDRGNAQDQYAASLVKDGTTVGPQTCRISLIILPAGTINFRPRAYNTMAGTNEGSGALKSCAMSLFGTNTRYGHCSTVREYRSARQVIWVVQVVLVASNDECGSVTVWEVFEGGV